MSTQRSRSALAETRTRSFGDLLSPEVTPKLAGVQRNEEMATIVPSANSREKSTNLMAGPVGAEDTEPPAFRWRVTAGG